MVAHRSDDLSNLQTAQNVMLAAFTDGKKVVAVAVNYTHQDKHIRLKIKGIKTAKTVTQYLTTANADDNMRPSQLHSVKNIKLQPKSITTFVLE